jgi:hypothetical protein
MGNGTWKEVVPPKGANIITSKWVFTIKTLTIGVIDRFKARIVARGFTQIYGVDYDETYAPTLRHDTLRLFLTSVAAENLECRQYDIKNAFTESFLKDVTSNVTGTVEWRAPNLMGEGWVMDRLVRIDSTTMLRLQSSRK